MKKIQLKNKVLEINSCLLCPCKQTDYREDLYCCVDTHSVLLFTDNQFMDYVGKYEEYQDSLETLFPLEEPKSIWEIPDTCPLEDLN